MFVEAGILVTPRVAAVIGPVLMRSLDDARRAREYVIPEAVATIEYLVRVGRAERARARSDVPLDVPVGIPQRTSPGTLEGMSTSAAAAVLGVTPRAVRARLQRGTLAGEQTPAGWRVFLDPDDNEVMR